MIRLKTKHLDVLSNPDHRWVVTKPNKISKLDNTKVLTSEELYNSDKPYAIPTIFKTSFSREESSFSTFS